MPPEIEVEETKENLHESKNNTAAEKESNHAWFYNFENWLRTMDDFITI